MSLPTTNHISLPFTVVDVFTETAYTGNPLAIVHLPPLTDFSPTQSQLQAVASEFNLSETVFLEDATPEDIQQQHRRARIFTTTREILFAGHPTIGTSTWLLHHGPQTHPITSLVPGAGPIAISPISTRSGYVSAIIPHTFHQHARKVPAANLLALPGTMAPFITADDTFPIVSIVHGMTFILVPLPSLEALAAARLGNQAAAIAADSGILDEGWEYKAPLYVYFYVRNAEAESEDGVETIRTRMLVRGIEDPATGSAASALTGYIARSEVEEKGPKRKWKVVQGVEMGRRSEIGVNADIGEDEKAEGNIAGMRITLNGTAVVVSEGRIRVYAANE